MRWSDMLRAVERRQIEATHQSSADATELTAALALLKALAPNNRASSVPSFVLAPKKTR